jgi:hypothetical protein
MARTMRSALKKSGSAKGAEVGVGCTAAGLYYNTVFGGPFLQSRMIPKLRGNFGPPAVGKGLNDIR